MNEVKIIINGEEFPIGYAFLSDFAYNLSQKGQSYAELAKALVELKYPELITKLFPLAKFEMDLSEMDALWEINNISICRTLVSDSFFLTSLTDAQISDIIKRNDKKTLVIITHNIQHLLQLEQKYKGDKRRASKEMVDKLLEHIRTSPFPEVREAYMKNLADKRRPSFREYMESGDYDFNDLPLKTMAEDDLKYLKLFDSTELFHLSNSLYCLSNEKIKKKVIKFLCTHPDPEVRYHMAEMASNNYLPLIAKKILMKDPEPDIAELASKEADD